VLNSVNVPRISSLFPEALRDYVAYVRETASGYVSVTLPVGDAMELSVRAR